MKQTGKPPARPEWSIKNFRGVDLYYACDIYFGKARMLSCEQRGDGGSNLYRRGPEAPPDALDQFNPAPVP